MTTDNSRDDSGEDLSLDDEENTPGIIESLGGLTKLFLYPEPALETLYAVYWPRFVLTLCGLCILIPLLGNFLVDDSTNYRSFFLFLNHQFELSPSSFRKWYFYFCGLGLGIWVVVGGLLLRLLFRMQSVMVTTLDCVAANCYALFPALILIMLRHVVSVLERPELLEHLGLRALLPLSTFIEPYATPLSLMLTILLYVSLVWGAYLWIKAVELISELPLPRIIVTGGLFLLVPCFLFVLFVTFSVLDTGDTAVRPGLDHIIDSIEMQREKRGGLEPLTPEGDASLGF